MDELVSLLANGPEDPIKMAEILRKHGYDKYSLTKKIEEKKALSVEEISKIILDHGGINTGNPNADSRICAQAIHSAMPAKREVRYPEKEYCGKINTALHNDNCEECKYHKLRNKLIDKMKKLNGG